MKNKATPPKTTRRGFNAEKFWRHYVAAVDTDDASWDQQQEKSSKAGKIFMFLLLFHVFLIGSIVLFNLVAQPPKPVFADGTPPNKKTSTSDKLKGTSSAVKSGDAVEYVVVSGDSLKSIAEKTGSTQEEIVKMNQLNANGDLDVGNKLLVPKHRLPVVQQAKVQEMVVAVQTTTKPGVTESFTAAVPAPSHTEQKKAPESAPPKPAVVKAPAVVQDKLPEDKPKPKPVEATPAPKPTETKAVVKAEEPKKPAPPKPDTAPKAAPVAAAASEKPAATGTTHIVKPKDTFYSISRKYGVKVDALMKANGFTDPSKLRDGLSLKIPPKS